MHIPDGILPPLVLATAYLTTGTITAFSLRRINNLDDPRAAVPKAAMMTAAFFVASLISIPLPPPMTSAHLILAGTMGVMLGWYAFPAIVIGLILQAIVFGHGGITSLGANALIMGTPALLMSAFFRRVTPQRPLDDKMTLVIAFFGGFLGVVIAATIYYGFIITTLPADIDRATEINATILLCLSHLPVALVEGIFTVALVRYLRRTRPDLLGLVSPRIA